MQIIQFRKKKYLAGYLVHSVGSRKIRYEKKIDSVLTTDRALGRRGVQTVLRV